ncbi:D-2-hydroxyglutarate dehydrogenase, mitochondrial [Glycine max]|nr:D-2-hydroxyglutarate dehydrogenase, mitochondrial [Glycine max]
MIVIVCKPRKFDREADEWIAREHAKEIANNKSMDIVGIRDTEIHNYQINLKGNVVLKFVCILLLALISYWLIFIPFYRRQKPEAFLLGSMENEMISDGVLAQDINQASSFWLLREAIELILVRRYYSRSGGFVRDACLWRFYWLRKRKWGFRLGSLASRRAHFDLSHDISI